MSNKNTIDEVRLHHKDTGSADVQIVVLTERLESLRKKYVASGKANLKIRKDMLISISRRQSLLDYLKLTDTARYKNIVEVLGITWI